MFFIELDEMRNEYYNYCSNYNIELLTPVYDLASDVRRKTELMLYNIVPKTLKAQCLIGTPMVEQLTLEQRDSLLRPFRGKILPNIEKG